MPVTRRCLSVLALLALATPLLAEDAKETPGEAFAALQKAVKAKDFDALWSFFSVATRKIIVEQMTPELEGVKTDAELLEALSKVSGKTVEELKKMGPEEFAKTSVMSEKMGNPDGIDHMKFLKAEVKGQEAVCTTKDTEKGEDAPTEEFVMVLEEGRWRMDFAATDRLKSAGTPQAAFEAYRKAEKAKNVDAAWGFYSEVSQVKLIREMSPSIGNIRKDAESMKAISANSGKSIDALNEMSAEEFVKTWVTSKEMQVPAALDRLEWIGAKVEGNTAVCTILNRMFEEEGAEDLRAMVLEDGTWKFDVEATDKLYEDK